MLKVLGGAGEEFAWLYYLARIIELGTVLGFMIMWAMVMQRALRACSKSNRNLEPGLTFLILVPVFGMIWQFIAVKKTAESLAQEYFHRGWQSDEGRPGIEIGMITCGIFIIVAVLRVIIPDLNPGISFLMSVGVCISIFMHRERLMAFTERLEKSNQDTPMFFVFEQFNNPFAAQQQQQQISVQPSTKIPEPGQADYHNPGWDGVSTWSPPSGWEEPDVSDPRPWFS